MPGPDRSDTISRFWQEIREFISATDAVRLVWSATSLLPEFTFSKTRARFLATLGCDVQRGTAVMGPVYLVGPRDSWRNLHVGTGSVIGPRVTLCLDAPITLGKNVSIGPHAKLYTATHSLGAGSRRMHLLVTARPIVVEDGVWIGLGAIVLGGVRIGRGSVVAAGAVIRADVPENVLVAGNPATIVQELPPG